MKCGKKINYKVDNKGLLMLVDPQTGKAMITNTPIEKVLRLWEIK